MAVTLVILGLVFGNGTYAAGTAIQHWGVLCSAEIVAIEVRADSVTEKERKRIRAIRL